MSLTRPIFLFSWLLPCFLGAEPQDKFKCASNLFQQNYQNQNACALYDEIPQDLKDLSYIVLPNEEKYDSDRFNFNKRFNVFPHAIIVPNTPEEVAEALRILRKYNLKFSLRSGGNCDEPGSLSSQYIIDLRKFNTIQPDIEKEEVLIGAGCRSGMVVEQLGKINYAIPTGTSQTVGIAGLALGGGIGVLSRPYGLTCDSIKSMTLVNEASEIIEVNERDNPDLFWALKGGGNGSFGIVLGFTFQMYYVPFVSVVELKWSWNKDSVSKIIKTWQKWITALPESISSQLKIGYANGQMQISVTCLKVGKQPFDDWEDAFKDLEPRVNIFKKSYIDSAQHWSNASTIPFFKTKSKMVVQPLSEEVIQLIIAYFENLKKDNKPYSTSFEIDALGGKIRKGDTAFYPRHALEWWHQIIYWNDQKDEAEAVSYLRQFYSKISPHVSNHSYANNVDYDLGPDFLEIYYGTHVDRLIQVKNKYDPQNVFNWAQSIPLKR